MRDDLLRHLLAGIASTNDARGDGPSWSAKHYMALLTRVDWQASIAATPPDSVDVALLEPIADALAAIAARADFLAVVVTLCHILTVRLSFFLSR